MAIGLSWLWSIFLWYDKQLYNIYEKVKTIIQLQQIYMQCKYSLKNFCEKKQ